MKKIWLVVFLVPTLKAGAASDCSPLPLNRFSIGQKVTATCQTPNQSEQVAEKIYLKEALSIRAEDLQCVRGAVRLISNNKADAEYEKIIKDAEWKSKFISKLKKDLVMLTADRGRLTPSMHKDQIIENDRQQGEIRDLIESSYQSMFLGSTTQMRELADTFADSTKTFAQKKAATSVVLQQIDYRMQLQEAEVKSNLNEDKEIKTELKKSLTIDSDILKKLTLNKSSEETLYTRTVQCHLDEKYGIRKQAASDKANLALNIVAVAIPIGTGFTLMKYAGSKAISSVITAKNATYASLGFSTAVGYASASDSLARACLYNSRDLKISTMEKCTGSEEDTKKFMIDNLKKQDCAYEFMMQTALLVPMVGFESYNFMKNRAAAQRLANSPNGSIDADFFSAVEYERLTKYGRSVSSRLTTLQKSNDPHALYLKQVGIVPNSRLSPTQIFNRVDEGITDDIASGTLKSSEALRPGRPYMLKSGEIKMFGLQDKIPADATPYTALLPEREFWQFVADGHVGVGEVNTGLSFAGNQLGSDFLHDVTHFSGLKRNPEFAKTLRETAVTTTKMSDEDFKAALPRLQFVSEQISAFPKNSEAQLTAFVGIVKPAGKTDLLNQSDYFNLLQKKTDSELRVILVNTKKLPQLEGLGGLSGDTVARTSKLSNTTMAPFESAYEGGSAGAFLDSTGFDRDAAIEVLSSKLTVADHLKGQSAAQLTKDIVAFKKDSPAIKLFCNNPQIWHSSHYASAICKQK